MKHTKHDLYLFANRIIKGSFVGIRMILYRYYEVLRAEVHKYLHYLAKKIL